MKDITTTPEKIIKFFDEIHLSDISTVGGKNCSLGEMYNLLSPKGVKIPYGFAVTAKAYRNFLEFNRLEKPIAILSEQLDHKNFTNLKEIGNKLRKLMLSAVIPENIKNEITEAYKKLCNINGTTNDVAVRSR